MKGYLQISPHFYLPLSEVEIQSARSSGPGGQNANKVNTKVVLRWNVKVSQLPASAKRRLLSKMNTQGELVIYGQRFRSRELNLKDVLKRLQNILRESLVEPKLRKATKPKASVKEKRLSDKRVKAEKKRSRSHSKDFFDT